MESAGRTESPQSAHEGEVKVREDVLLLRSEDAGCPRGGEDWLQASKLLIEVTHVLRRSDGRQEGGLHLFGQESVPVRLLWEHEEQESLELPDV